MSKSELHAIVERGHELAESTRARYLRDLDVWIEFAGVNPQSWTTDRAEGFYASLLGRMTPQSANRLMASIAYAASWRARQAHDPRLDFVDPIRRAKKAPSENPRAPLSHEAAQQLVRACMGPTALCVRDMALIVVELETGMRCMSIQSMLWEQLDQGEHGYPVARVLAKGHDKHRQEVPLSDTALAVLNAWQTKLGAGTNKGPVFRSLERGKKAGKAALSATAIQKIVSARAEQAGIGHVHPHLFRHTFVTWRLNAGIPWHEIAAVTGHRLSGELGAIAGYFDVRTVGEKVRNSTPEWLRRIFIP